MQSSDFLTGMQLLGRIPDLVARTSSSSLSEYVSEARVEPPVLVDRRAYSLPYIQDVMHVANSLYSSYYLQAWALSVDVGDVNVRQVLNSLNDRRKPIRDVGALAQLAGAGAVASMASRVLSEDDFKYGLPSFEDDSSGGAFKRAMDSSAIGFGRDATKDTAEAGNLAVGRVLEVKIKSNGQEASIPVTVRLNVSLVEPEQLTHILTLGNEDKSAKARWHGWRSGRLEFIRDVILQQDLIDSHKNTLMKDTSGYYKELIRKRKDNKLSAILSLNPTVATAATIVVITSDTLRKVESIYGAKISDLKMRQKLFKETYTTLMFVIDTEWEQVDIYHRGIDQPTELSIRDLKAATKGSGPDVTEIMKAYQMGRTVTI
jgi:hypothetical protein